MHGEFAPHDELIPEHIDIAPVVRRLRKEFPRSQGCSDRRDLPKVQVWRQVALLSLTGIVALLSKVYDRWLPSTVG